VIAEQEIAMTFTLRDIPPQAGRVAVITGATSGIGLETAKALAGAGARVIIASRNEKKGAAIVAEIRATHPGVEASFETLDLSSLESVKSCAERIAHYAPRIDLLINNAGVMAIPNRHETVDGFEMQFGANYVGHFALTMRLLPNILAADRPRVVTVSSLAHRSGRIDFDDLQARKRYSPWKAYCQSKLATLMFSLELDRRARAEGWALMSNAAHPGFARTDLQRAGRAWDRETLSALEWLGKLLQPVLSHSAEAGALPTLLAATSQQAQGGVMYGPDGLYEMMGPPKLARIVARAQDKSVWKRLWDLSEAMTGLTVPALESA
jgi:NAD(P)-dependent dehydrogenase (short-subunit alcohol dehydrogenase family)